MSHETHVCRDCGAEITLPYGRVDLNLEGYWERAYWNLVPKLQEALTFALAHQRRSKSEQAQLEHEGRIHEAHIREGIPDQWCRYCFQLKRPGVAFGPDMIG